MGDGGDCENRDCFGGHCGNLYMAWVYLAGSKHHLNHSSICTDGTFEEAISLMDLDEEDFVECEVLLEQYDYNQDSRINFREFTALGYSAGTSTGSNFDSNNTDGFLGAFSRSANVNCSVCTGMEFYNV